MPLFGAVTGLAALGFAGYQYAKSRGDKRKSDADFTQALRNRAKYATPPSVTNVAADAQSRLNAQNPATLAAQQQIQQTAAAQAGFAQRNASSGTQALQAAADANAQTYSALPALAAQDQQYRDRAVQNYYGAQQGLTEDARFQHADALDANNTQAQYALGKVGAAQQEGSQALALGVESLGMLGNVASQYRRPTTTVSTAVDPSTSGMYGQQGFPNYGLYGYSNGIYQPRAFRGPYTYGRG